MCLLHSARTEKRGIARNPSNLTPFMRMEEGAVSPHEAYFLYKITTLKSVRQGKWKLHIRYEDKNLVAGELYNLDADIGETNDVSGSNPAVVSRLMALARTARTDIGDFYVDGTGHRMAK